MTSKLDGVPRDFYGHQLKDRRGSAEINQMIPEDMSRYASCAAGRSPEAALEVAIAS